MSTSLNLYLFILYFILDAMIFGCTAYAEEAKEHFFEVRSFACTYLLYYLYFALCIQLLVIVSAHFTLFYFIK